MRRRGFRLAHVAVSVIVVVVFSTTGITETLKDLLRAHNIPENPQPTAILDKPITSYGVLDDEKDFVVAYYVDDGSGQLREPLLVSHFDKVARRWRSAAILEVDARARGVSIEGSRFNIGCLGSVTRIYSSDRAFYLDTHLNPSAGCLMILSRDLAVQKSLYGWFLAAFGDGSVVYHNSEIHFAPTHHAEISVYDRKQNRDVKIYPMKPYQRIRTGHINKVRVAWSDEAWCREHNHHCNPELFDNDVRPPIFLNDATSSIAFVAAFDNTNYWSEEERLKGVWLSGVREELEHEGVEGEPSTNLFMALERDLARIRGGGMQEQVLELFKSDQELHDLLVAAFVAEKDAGQDSKRFTDALDPRWKNREIWKRLAEAIQVPTPEFTDVLYIYRNVNNGRPIEYKEILLTDFRRRFGGITLEKCLEPAILTKVFGR